MNGTIAHVDLVLSALAANRAFAEEIQRSLDELSEEEKQLHVAIQAVHQRLAMRRAERAMTALGWHTGSAGEGAAAQDTGSLDVFERDVESRYKRVGVVPRSFIRHKPSFFNSPPEKKPVGPRKRIRRKVLELPKPEPVFSLANELEPFPNIDTLFLRQYSHQAFQATPSKVFTAKEREVVRRFATEHTPDGDFTKEIPLATWNLITHSTKPTIHRSGFACKLWWELHDNPTLRLCAWTKEEDRVLKELASGKTDPRLVNGWAEIAKRMPHPGRPPVHCLIRYMTKLCASNLNEKFSPEEDELLKRAVEVFGEKWTIIADLMDGRIAEQLRHRWQLSLSPQVKLGKFSVMEDRRLLLALYAYHDRDEQFNRDAVQWHQICHHIAGRPPPPVRDRFVSSINPEVTFRDWTPEEDIVIRSGVESCGFASLGLWPRLAAELGNRTDNQVARRARTLFPAKFKAYQEEKKSGEKATLPTIFRRTINGRRDPKTVSPHEKRSSYNRDDHDPLEETTEDEGEVVVL